MSEQPFYCKFHDASHIEYVLAREPRPVMVSRDEHCPPRTYEPGLMREKAYTLDVHYAVPGVSRGVSFSWEFRHKGERDRVWEFLAPAEDLYA